MDSSTIAVFMQAAAFGAWLRLAGRFPARENERGAVDARSMLIGLAIVAVTLLTAIGRPIPALLTQIVVAVIGGGFGATIAGKVDERSKKRPKK